MSGYFEDLAARLRAAGVPEERVAATVDDLRAYLGDSGTDPEEEFGPAAEFAGMLTAGEEPAAAGPAQGERWVWTADIFVDRRRLNEFGEQGWEVETIDNLGRFVCTRAAERPQRWEYRREVVTPADREEVGERLAHDGWEPCGTWLFYAYYKRPKAALVGPAAELDAAPPRPAGRAFFSRRFYLFLAVYLVVLGAVLVGAGGVFSASSFDGGLDTIAGMITGAAAVLGVIAGIGYLAGRRQRRGR